MILVISAMVVGMVLLPFLGIVFRVAMVLAEFITDSEDLSIGIGVVAVVGAIFAAYFIFMTVAGQLNLIH